MNVKGNTMLDADISAVSARPRPASRLSAASASRRPASAPRPLASVSPRSAPKAGRLARSEMRLLAFAVTATVIVCGLLVLYLAAYARVSRLGMDLSRHRVELRALQQQNQLLQAQVAGLENPQRLTADALAQGMRHGASHTDYLAPLPPVSDSSEAAKTVTEDGQDTARGVPRLTANTQVTNRGETTDNSKTASSKTASSNH